MTTPSHAVIVGTGPRLGLAYARRFGAGGHRISMIARQPNRLAGYVDELLERGIEAQYAAADVLDHDGLTDALEKLQTSWGAPNVVIYNAAQPIVGRVGSIDPNQLSSAIATSAIGWVSVLQSVLPAMIGRGSGTILVTGTGAAVDPSPHDTANAAAKAAVRALALGAARDYERDGVHIAVVSINGEPAAGGNFDPARIAETFWSISQETSGDWTFERAFTGHLI
jgi:NADP-dependent 3-hydroxy acid dehydrogenase YdfG